MIDVASIRARLGLSQTALAQQLGVDQSTVSRWETGELSPSGPALILLRQLEQQAKTTTKTTAAAE